MAIKFLNTVQVDTDVLYVDTANDRVGIGTASPGAELDVDGAVITRGNLGFINYATQSEAYYTKIGTQYSYNESFAIEHKQTKIMTFSDSNTFGLALNGAGLIRFMNGSGEKMRISDAGNVGIGTEIPGAKLDVDGVIRSRGGTYIADIDTKTDVGLVIPANDFIYTADGSSYLRKLIGKASDIITIGEAGTSLTDGINLKPGTTGGYVQVFNNSSIAAKFVNDKLSLGMSDPQQKLHIVDTGGANIILNSNTGAENNGIWMTEGGISTPYANGAYVHYDSTNNAFKINTGTSTLTTRFTIKRDSGKVGIGTPDPSHVLSVQDSVNNADVGISIKNSFDDNLATSNPNAVVTLSAASNNGYLRVHGAPADTAAKHQIDLGSTAGSSFLTFSPGGAEKMRITTQGKVGIGTISPSQKLEVDGVIESPYLEYKPFVFYDFNSDTVSQWGLNNATLSTPSKSVTRFTTTGLDANLNRSFNGSGYNSPAIPGGQNQIIRIRYKWISGAGSTGEIFYATTGHSYHGSYYKAFSLNTDGEYHTLVLDMSNLNSGGTDWIDNDITGIRFDLVNSTPIVIDIDWIAVGGNGWGTQYFENDVAFMNGDVGIGTTSPNTDLEVKSTIPTANRTIPLDIITITGEGTNLPYTGSGGGIVFKNRTYNYGLLKSARIRSYIDADSASNRGAGLVFEVTNSNQTYNRSLFLKYDGNVGIGTINPGYKLDVSSASAVGARISTTGFTNLDLVSSRTSGNLGGLRFKQDIDAAQTGEFLGLHGGGFDWKVGDGSVAPGIKMRLDSDGNLGIGNTNPGAKLDVNGRVRIGDINYSYGGSNYHILLAENSNDAYISNINGYGILSSGGYYYGASFRKLNSTSTSYSGIQTRPDGKIAFENATGGTAGGNITASIRMLISGNGNVGIGTASPTSALGSTKVLDISSTGNGEIILDHTDAGTGSDLGLYSWARNNDHLAHIKATCDGSTTAAFISFHAQPSGGSFSNAASNEKMRIKSNGNVGINTTNPGQKLTVNGRFLSQGTSTPFYIKVSSAYKSWVHHIGQDDGYIFAPSTADGGETWDWANQTKLGANGVVTAKNFQLSSDKRFKNNIKDIKDIKVEATFKSFEMESSPGEKRYGVVAQELEKTNPELVETDHEGFKSVKYIDLLIAKIAELEARLEKLEK